MKSGLTISAPNELWEEVLRKDGRTWGRIVSDSMAPSLRRGDEVLVELIDPGSLRFADVAVFRRGGALVTHRVIGKRRRGKEQCYLEKGDASLFWSLVAPEAVVGRVIAVRRGQRSRRTLSGAGRMLQLTLGLISLISLSLWLASKRLPGRNLGRRRHYGTAYNRSVAFIQRVAVRLLA